MHSSSQWQVGRAQPLPSGVVPPDGALLLASVLYIAVLIAACLMVRAASSEPQGVLLWCAARGWSPAFMAAASCLQSALCQCACLRSMHPSVA